jgi:ABC-type uncharacterized transport system fused permease/ATPase subunit
MHRRSPALQDQDADLHQPLLQSSSQPKTGTQHQEQRQQTLVHGTAAATTTAAGTATSRSAKPAPHPVDLGWVFACRLWRILLLVRGAIPAVLLAAMAVSEAVIISRIGTISSKFYQAFVDNQRSSVAHLMLWSGGCYAATTLFFTMKSGLQDFLAWRWRAALTLHLQQLYCSNLAFCSLQVSSSSSSNSS